MKVLGGGSPGSRGCTEACGWCLGGGRFFCFFFAASAGSASLSSSSLSGLSTESRSNTLVATYGSLEEDSAKRALWVAWKHSLTEELCMEHVLNYVSAREDEVLEEGLWRTRFARKVHEDAAANADGLSSLQASHRALRESQTLLLKRHEEQGKLFLEMLAELVAASLRARLA